jgi:tetratricopeptide (TPR) repeat protein
MSARTSTSLRANLLIRRWMHSRALGMVVFVVPVVSLGCCRFRPHSADQSVIQARQLSLQGMEAAEQGRSTDAEKIFASAVKACPTDERARHCYAESLWNRGARSEAVQQLEHAVKLSSGDPQRIVQLGQWYLDQGNTEDAQRCAEAAIARSPRLSSAWALCGKVHSHRGEWEGALADYHRSLSYEKQQPEIQKAVAEVYRRQNRPHRALATLEALGEQYPPGEVPAEIYGLQGLALNALGRQERAIEQFLLATQGESPDPEWLCELADAYRASGDTPSALATLDRALAIYPDYAPAHDLRSEWKGLSKPAEQVADREQANTIR